MSIQNGGIGNNTNNYNMTLEQARSGSEDASSRTTAARDLMEAFSPANVLGEIGEILKMVLGGLSG